MVQRFIPYGCQSINQEDIDAVTQALKGEIITRGAVVQEFERTVAEYCNAEYAVAFSSGTAALAAATSAAKVTPSDRLISSPNTFIGTIAEGERAGATTVFVDIDAKTGNIDLNQLEFNLNKPSTRGKEILIPIHFSGTPMDMSELSSMIADPRTIVIEDAAHAIGSHYPTGEKVGSCAWSDMTVFSFHPAKTITTGEGGMVTTNQEELYHSLLRYRNNGIERNAKSLNQPLTPWYYEIQEISGNYNFTDFQAALGLSQFQRLDKFIAKRQRLVTKYRKLLEGKKHISFLTSPPKEGHIAYHLFVVLIDFATLKTSREEVMLKLRDEGIGTQVHYIPLYRHPYFLKKMNDISEYFPQAEKYYSQALSLPLHAEMDENDVEEICLALQRILNK